MVHLPRRMEQDLRVVANGQGTYVTGTGSTVVAPLSSVMVSVPVSGGPEAVVFLALAVAACGAAVQRMRKVKMLPSVLTVGWPTGVHSPPLSSSVIGSSTT